MAVFNKRKMLLNPINSRLYPFIIILTSINKIRDLSTELNQLKNKKNIKGTKVTF